MGRRARVVTAAPDSGLLPHAQPCISRTVQIEQGNLHRPGDSDRPSIVARERNRRAVLGQVGARRQMQRIERAHRSGTRKGIQRSREHRARKLQHRHPPEQPADRIVVGLREPSRMKRRP